MKAFKESRVKREVREFREWMKSRIPSFFDNPPDAWTTTLAGGGRVRPKRTLSEIDGEEDDT